MNLNKASHFYIFLGLMFSFLFTTVGLAMIFWLASYTTFNCQRINSSNEGSCQLKTVAGPSDKEHIRTFPLRELKSASLESSTSSSSSKRTYYVSLETSTGEIDLPTNVYGASGTRASLVTEVNDFIKNPEQTTLNIQEDDLRWQMYLFGGVFLSIPNLIAIYCLKLGIQELRNE